MRCDSRRDAVLESARRVLARGGLVTAYAVAAESGEALKTCYRWLAVFRREGPISPADPSRPNPPAVRPPRTKGPPAPDIAERVEHYAARVRREWDLFTASPFGRDTA